jgi:hypothetical protein
VSDLALDPVSGDLVIRDGDLALVHGAQAVAQDWALRIGMFRGEWALDRRVGIDYQGAIFDAPRAMAQHVFEKVTRETAGVASVERLEFAFDPQTRVLTVSAAVTTTNGEPLQLEYSNVLFEDATEDTTAVQT